MSAQRARTVLWVAVAVMLHVCDAATTWVLLRLPQFAEGAPGAAALFDRFGEAAGFAVGGALLVGGAVLAARRPVGVIRITWTLGFALLLVGKALVVAHNCYLMTTV